MFKHLSALWRPHLGNCSTFFQFTVFQRTCCMVILTTSAWWTKSKAVSICVVYWELLVVTVAVVSFLHCLLVSFYVAASLRNGEATGKKNQHKTNQIKINSPFKLFCIWFSYFCHLVLHHSLSLCHALVYAYTYLCVFFHISAWLPSITFSLTHSKSCSCSSYSHSGSHIPHTSSFLSVFTPWALLYLLCCTSFSVLHFTLSLCHICSILPILSLESWGYICSAA